MKKNNEMPVFPELTEAMIKECNNHFEPYVFYNFVNGVKKCWCTNCNEHYSLERIQKMMERDHYEAYGAAHNQTATCQKCGRYATYKNIGKARQRLNLAETKKIIFILPKNEKEVYFRAFFVKKDYYGKLTPELELSETSKYYLRPGKAKKWKCDYDHTYLGEKTNEFIFQECVGEPFARNNNMWGYSDNTYYFVNFNAINKTFLKYSQLNEFEDYIINTNKNYNTIDIPVIKYLCHYTKCPQIEMMMKLGFEDFVKDRIIYGKYNKRLVNWNAKNAADAFKMTSQEFKEFRESEPTVEAYKRYKELKKKGYNCSHSDIKKYICDFRYHIDGFIDLVKELKISPSQAYNYLIKKKDKQSIDQVLIFWKDYVSAAKSLKYDLDDEVVYMPKNLKKAHDDAIKNVKYIEDVKQAEKMKTLEPDRIKQYAFENEEFFIKVPDSMQEIIEEGKALKHCVGGYAARHAEGKKTILFLRKKSDPSTPLYTIEINDKVVMQAQGYKNCTPMTEKAKAFFEKWKAWVQAGSKKAKNKKTTEKVA